VIHTSPADPHPWLFYPLVTPSVHDAREHKPGLAAKIAVYLDPAVFRQQRVIESLFKFDVERTHGIDDPSKIKALILAQVSEPDAVLVGEENRPVGH
jgi:hypothetical protein